MKVQVKTDQFKNVELNEVKDYQDLTPLQKFCVDNDYPCFEVVEDEYEVGDWVIAKNGYTPPRKVLEVNKNNLIVDGHERFLDGHKQTYTTSYCRKATPKEIEQALIEEAKRRGLIVGAKINNSNIHGFSVNDKKIENHRHLEYDKKRDSLYYAYSDSPKTYPIYEKGEWAEIIEDDPISINGYEVEVKPILNESLDGTKIMDVKVGCKTIYASVFQDLSMLAKRYDLSIFREAEDITKQIHEIADKVK